MNSRSKGKRGELELARLLRERGFSGARRGQQYSGLEGDADVVGIPGYHLEVKRVERLDLYGAMRQSVRDARPGEVPVVAHRKNREEWLITTRLEDFLDMLEGDR